MRPMFILLFCFLAGPAMQTLVAEEGRLTTEPGVELYWRAAGDGPVVIVPGGFLFHEDLDRLARSHRLILYDMRNRGRSAAVRDPELLTIDGDVRDLEAIRAHFQAESFSAIGYSYLGKMIVLYALKHPDRIDRLVQIGPVPMRFGSLMPPVWDNTAEQVMDPDAVARLRKLRAEGVHEERPREYCEDEWLVTRVRLVGDPALAARLESWCSLPNEWPARFADHLRHHFPSAQRANVTPLALARFDEPVLTIHGTRDRNAPYGAGREWAAMLPNGRLRTVADGAHQAWVDDPSVLDDLERFLGGAWPETAVDLDIAREGWLSQLRGVELLERSARVYGTSGAGDGGGVSFRLDGRILSPSQSKSPRPPFDPFPLEAGVAFDETGLSVVVDERFHWPGFVSSNRAVSRPDGGFQLDLNSGRIVDSDAPRSVWLNQVVRVPRLLIQQMLRSPGTVRFLGVAAGGEPYLMVAGTVEGEAVSVGIDGSDRIRLVMRPRSNDLLGDQVERQELEGEQAVDGTLMPRRIRRFHDGVLTADFEISAAPPIDRSRFELPDDAPQTDASGPPGERVSLQVDRLDEDLWVVRNIGGADYRSLVVVHDDGLVLLEAPFGEEAMDRVVARLQVEFPALPIKAAVVTHHHFDHSGGVRAAMKAGAEIIVPRGSEQLFRRIATAPRTLERDTERLDPAAVRIRGVESDLIEPEREGPRVQILALGENDHAEGMLFAWIPERATLFQGDLYVKRSEPEPARGQGVVLLRRIRELGLEPARIVGTHGEVATIEDLERAVAARQE